MITSNQFRKSGLVGVCFVVGFIAVSLITQPDMLWYRLEQFGKRAIFGQHGSHRMYQEELRRRSVESFRNNPNREEFLKKHPGFLEANPQLR